jgi:hypothetical protein
VGGGKEKKTCFSRALVPMPLYILFSQRYFSPSKP